MNLPTLVPIALTLFLFFFLFLFACALVIAYRAISGEGQKKEKSAGSAPSAPRAVVITPAGPRAAGHTTHNRRLIGVDQSSLLLTDWRWSNRPQEPYQ